MIGVVQLLLLWTLSQLQKPITRKITLNNTEKYGMGLKQLLFPRIHIFLVILLLCDLKDKESHTKCIRQNIFADIYVNQILIRKLTSHLFEKNYSVHFVLLY